MGIFYVLQTLTSTRLPMEETLESLYVINKHAGKYARKAREHYENDKHAAARRNSARKEALYDLKGRVLSTLAAEDQVIESIERHEIEGRLYLCLFIQGYAFHALPDEIDVDSERIAGPTKELSDFEKTEEKNASDRTLKASLLHLQETFGISANDLLPKETVKYAYRRSFNGWSYLERGLMETPVWKQKRLKALEAMHEARESESE